MADADRKRICDVLRRDAEPIAREAAQLFVRQMPRDTPFSSEVEDKPNEAEAMLTASFLRLTGVAAFSMQVDEPRLLSEELQGLGNLLRADFHTTSGAPYADLLIESFAGACRTSLSDGDCDLVRELFVQAHSGLDSVEPLLTESRTRSQLEGSTRREN